MSIVARIRPSVNAKPARVTKPLTVPFGAGLIPDVATDETNPIAKTIPELLAGGLASRRPRVDGYGLDAKEFTRLNGACNEARFQAERNDRPGKPLTSRQVHEAVEGADRAELSAILADRPILEPIVTPKPANKSTTPRGFYTANGVYIPSIEEERFAAEMFDEAEQAEREAAMEWASRQAEYHDTCRFYTDFTTDEDMAIVGAVG